MKPLTKRLPKGRPMLGTSATAADTVALLSGVNFASVVKVFAAIEALRTSLPIPPATNIARIIDAPLQPTRFDGTEADRVNATIFVVHDVAADPRVQYLDNILHLTGRFPARKLAEH